MSIQPRFPLWLPVAGLLLAIAHLSVEHISGGVNSHHLLNSADLPAISNWFELITLPLLAAMLGFSCRKQTTQATRLAGIPVNMGLRGQVLPFAPARTEQASYTSCLVATNTPLLSA